MQPEFLDWQTGLLAGWTYDKPVNKWFQGSFRSAHRITRPCPTCSGTIELDVTERALEGKATNHGLALRRCKACRAALKQGPEAYQERKQTVPRVMGHPTTMNTPELETLKMANKCMTEELDGLYLENKDLKTRLARYELQPAMEAAQNKMPWD